MIQEELIEENDKTSTKREVKKKEESQNRVNEECYKIEEINSAGELLTVAVFLDPENDKAWCCRGKLHNLLGDYERSYVDYSMSIMLEFNTPSTFYERANICKKLGPKFYKLGIEDCRDATRLAKNTVYQYTYLLADLLQLVNEYNEAIEYYVKSLETMKSKDIDSLVPKCHFNIGVCYLKLKQLDAALENMAIACSLDSQNPSNAFQLGNIYYERKEYEEAEGAYSTAIAASLQHPEYRYRRGQSRYLMGGRVKLVGAIDDFNSTIILLSKKKEVKEDSDDKKATEDFVQRAQEKKLSEEIKIRKSEDNEIKERTTKGEGEDEGEHKEGAEEKASSASKDKKLMVDNTNVPDIYFYELARAKMALMDLEWMPQVKEDIAEAIKRNSKKSDYYHLQGLCHEYCKEYEEAINSFELSLACNKNALPSAYHLALCYHKLGHLKNALNLFTYVLHSIKNEYKIWLSRGICLNDLEAYHRAIKDINKAIELHPSHSVSYYQHGRALSRLGEMREAIRSFDIAVELGFDDSVALELERGTLFKHQEKPTQALKSFNLALDMVLKNDTGKVNKRSFSSYSLEGKLRVLKAATLIDDGQPEPAVTELLQAEAIFTTFAPPVSPIGIEEKWLVLFNLAIAYLETKQFKESIDYFCKAIDMTDGQNNALLPEIHYRIAILYMLTEKYLLAYKHLTIVISEYKGSINQGNLWRCYIERGKCQMNLNKWESAIEDFNYITENLNPSLIHPIFLRAWCYKNCGKPKLAGIDFETCKEMDPSNINIHVDYRTLHQIRFVMLYPPGEEQGSKLLNDVSPPWSMHRKNGPSLITKGESRSFVKVKYAVEPFERKEFNIKALTREIGDSSQQTLNHNDQELESSTLETNEPLLDLCS